MKNRINNIRASEGFTIIEVVIVLVIAAIIMLAVFLVVPQLQRSQRNNRRQQDARQLLTAAEQYAANTGGTYAAQAATIPAGLLAISGALNVPGTTNAYTQGTIGTPSSSNLQYTYNTYTCTNNAPVAKANSTKVVIITGLETATSTPTGTTGTTAPTKWCVGN